MKTVWSVGAVTAVAAVLVSSGAYAQAAKATLVPYPLEFDPDPAVQRAEGPLRAALVEALRDRAGLILPTPKEVDTALKETRRQDCRESNECLAQLAQKAGTLYGMYTSLEYTSTKELVVVGRVVRDDGKLMGAGRVELPRGKDTLVAVFKVLLARLSEQLALKDLPTFKPVEPAPAPPPEKQVELAPPSREHMPPPPMPPLEVGARPLRMAGYVGVGGGLAVAAIGGIVFGTTKHVQTDPSNNVYPSDRAWAQDSAHQQTAGVALIVAGGVVAAAGAVLWAITPERAPKVAVVPVNGGGVVSLGGSFP
jgi:hypothetical protein